MKNIGDQPLNQLVDNRANSSGKKRKDQRLILLADSSLESALNFTLPVRAERHGHALQTANRLFTIYI